MLKVVYDFVTVFPEILKNSITTHDSVSNGFGPNMDIEQLSFMFGIHESNVS